MPTNLMVVKILLSPETYCAAPTLVGEIFVLRLRSLAILVIATGWLSVSYDGKRGLLGREFHLWICTIHIGGI